MADSTAETPNWRTPAAAVVDQLGAVGQLLARLGEVAQTHGRLFELTALRQSSHLLLGEVRRIEKGELPAAYVEDLATALAGVCVADPEAP